jgi:hypothetical protein
MWATPIIALPTEPRWASQSGAVMNVAPMPSVAE